MRDPFGNKDKHMLPAGGSIRWRNKAQWARLDLVHAGYMSYMPLKQIDYCSLPTAINVLNSPESVRKLWIVHGVGCPYKASTNLFMILSSLTS